MKKKIIKRYLILTVFFVFIICNLSYAFKFKHFEITPSVKLDHEYNDNYQKKPDDSPFKYSDNIFTISPKVMLKTEKKRVKLSLDGGLNIITYNRYAKENDVDNNIKADIDWKPVEQWNFKLTQKYENTYEGYDEGTDVASKDQVDKYTSTLNIDYNIGAKLDLNVNVDIADFSYELKNGIVNTSDRTERKYAATITYKFLPKTNLLFNYQLKDIDYDISTSDNKEQLLIVGVENKITAKISGSIKAGLIIKDYAMNNIDRKTSESHDVNLKYKLDKLTSLNFTLSKSTQERQAEIYNKYTETTSTSLAVNRKIKKKYDVEIKTQYSVDDYEPDDPNPVKVKKDKKWDYSAKVSRKITKYAKLTIELKKTIKSARQAASEYDNFVAKSTLDFTW